MLICLYVLPKSMPRYAITSSDDYYLNSCLGQVSSKLSIPVGNGTYNSGNPDAAWFCNVMNFCGFPKNGNLANTVICPLYRGTPLPSSQTDAVCFNNATNLGAGCTVNDQLNTANDYMGSQLKSQNESDWTHVLSVLFNAFIMCQVRLTVDTNILLI